MADLAFSHPELARRWDLFVGRCWERSWDPFITSSSRGDEQQRTWFALYQMVPPEWPAIVADPDRDAGATPFGCRGHGSLHMIQCDGYSHALDVGCWGPDRDEFHALAWTCGLGHPEPSEWWHLQAFDAFSNGFYPVEENDMTLEEFMRGTGREGDDLGCLKIIEGKIHQKLSDGNWYTLADRDEFIHRKLYPIAPPGP